MATNLPFCQMVRASGLAEPWTHSHEESKFDQFGWRCTTKESGFGISTLVGNYNEDRFDLKHRLKSKPLPSQVWPGSQQKIELSCLFTVYTLYYLHPFFTCPVTNASNFSGFESHRTMKLQKPTACCLVHQTCSQRNITHSKVILTESDKYFNKMWLWD